MIESLFSFFERIVGLAGIGQRRLILGLFVLAEQSTNVIVAGSDCEHVLTVWADFETCVFLSIGSISRSPMVAAYITRYTPQVVQKQRHLLIPIRIHTDASLLQKHSGEVP